MLAQERRLMWDLSYVGHQRGITERQNEIVAALGMAARFLRSAACQPSDTMCESTRMNLSIAAKAAEIALR